MLKIKRHDKKQIRLCSLNRTTHCHGKLLLIALTIFISFPVWATQSSLADPRRQLPAVLNQTYMGASVGYTDIPFSNAHLINGFRAESFKNPDIGLSVFIGHFFNRYLAGQISLMRPIKWSYANNITPNKRYSIWTSLFGLALRPTLPITHQLSMYGLSGLGIVSRHGFQVNNVTAMPSVDLITLFTGGGLTYAIDTHWHWDVGFQYALARPTEHQPSIWYASTGFYYLFTPLHLSRNHQASYLFHRNLIQIGAFSTTIFNPSINKYFTIPYLPIFWTGKITTRDGMWMMYHRNIFHTQKRFSLDVGVSAATYRSTISNTDFQTLSLFPEMRLWFYRSHLVDWYFNYSIAGPTYITRKTIDRLNSGGHLTFQDLLGVGCYVGHNKNANIDFKIGHYSNGNLLPNNPGIQVPLVISIGYAF